MKFGQIISLMVTISVVAGMVFAAEPMEKVGGSAELSPVMDFDGSFRHMTDHNETSSSPCIGKTETPVCAMETYMAGIFRDDEDLVAIGKGISPASGNNPAKKQFKDIHGYRVVSVRQFTLKTIEGLSRNTLGIKPLEAAIMIESRTCTYKPCDEAVFTDTTSYLLQKGEYGWFVIFSVSNIRDLTDLRDIEDY